MIKERLEKGLKNWKEFMGFNMVEIMETNIHKQNRIIRTCQNPSQILPLKWEFPIDTLQNYKLLSDRTPKVSDSLNQEQLDILSSTEFQCVTFCHVLKPVITLYGEYYNRLSSFTTKTI